MKKLYSFFVLVLLVVASAIPASAYDFYVDGIYYRQLFNVDNEVEVCTSDDGSKYAGNLVIPESISVSGVTYKVSVIGYWAFKDCYDLSSVTIPNSVKTIGENAFYNCHKLTSVDIPNSVTTLGDGAFSNCANLSSVTISDSLTTLNAAVFRSCANLTSVAIPSSVTTLGNYVFADCINLTSITIPNSVKTIGSGAFNNCQKLTSVDIPNSVTTLGGNVFEDCINLSSITIPNSVTTLGLGLFRKCTNLSSVVLPNSITIIPNSSFYECSNLLSIDIPNSVDTIAGAAFVECTRLTDVTIGENVKQIGEFAFDRSKNITSINSKAKTPPTLMNERGGVFDKSIYSKVTLQVPQGSEQAYMNAKEWQDLYAQYVEVDGISYALITETEAKVVSKLDGTFYVGDYVIPSQITYGGKTYTVTSIGNAAFMAPFLAEGSVTSIVIPNTVTTIEDNAFSCCNFLSSVVLGDSVSKIGKNAFYDTRITKFTTPALLTEIEDNAFTNCLDLTNLTIGENISKIGFQAFFNCNSLDSITVKAVTPPTMESMVFNDEIYSRAKLTVPEGSEDAYKNAEGWNMFSFDAANVDSDIKYNVLSDSTVAVISKESAYKGDIVIPSETVIGGKTYTVTEIGSQAFANSEITSVVIPNTVTKINNRAFYSSQSLTSVTIGERVAIIDYYAFGSCPLDSITSLAQTPPSLSQSAFDTDIYSNAKLTVPEGCEDAYKTAQSWYKFYPDGSYAEFSFEPISETKVALTYVSSPQTAHIRIPSETTIDGKTYTVTEIKGFAVSGTVITSVVIPNTVVKLEDNAFRFSSGLKTITLGSSVATIGSYAFFNCPALDSISCLAQTPPTLANNAFEGDFYSKAKLTVPEGSENAYKKAKGWYKFYPDGYYVDYSPISETEVAVVGVASELPLNLVIPSETVIDGKTYSVTEIGFWVFSQKRMTSVVIPNTVTKIKEGAFYACEALKTLTLGSSVATIGNNAFVNCFALDSISCLAQTPPAFGGNNLFDDDIYSKAKLTVPERSEDAYKKAKGWYKFYPDGSYAELRYETISETEVAVVGIDSEMPSNLVIPSETVIEGKTYSVTEIGAWAFAWNVMTSIVIPNTVTKIKEGAFYYCQALKTLTIGSSVATIDNDAFSYCSALDSISCLGQTPPTLGNNVFDDIYSKAKLTVPEGCEDAYKKAKGWYKFYPDGNYVDTEINYEIISDSTVAVVRKESGYLCKVVIPSETVIEGKTYKVTEIGEEAFSRTDAITSVTIPNTVTKIGIRAFYSCESLTSMTLPDSLVTIENWAFESCHKLASINLPNSVSTIGFRTFYDCTVLNEVIIPKSLKTIEEEAFAKCNNLTKVVIGDSVENIKHRAFAESSKLTTLTIGRNVKQIESDVFAGCGAIDSIVVLAQTPPDLGSEVFASIVYASASLTVPAGCEDAYKNTEGWKNFYKEYHNDEGIWYDELTDTEVTVMAVSSGSSDVVIPSETTIDGVTYTVTTIGKAAFKNCSDVKSVEIPASVTEICETAFQGCSELTEVTIGEISSQGRKNIKLRAVRNTDVTIASFAFKDCKKLTTLVLGENVTIIKEGAFIGCNALVSITCYAQTPPTIEREFYQDDAFDAETYKKATLTVPDGCKDAYKAAEYWKEFYKLYFDIDGIQYKTISDTEVEIVSNNAYIDELVIPSQFTVDGVTYSVTSIAGGAFAWGVYSKVVIPNSVTNIGERAFGCCQNMSTLVIGSNVKTIGDEAFAECYSLSMIEVYATTPPAANDNVFSSEIYSTAMLSVPIGSEDAYRTAKTWKEFSIVSEITGVEGVLVEDNILGYFNLHGTMSDKPWEGVNIVVYKDGTRRKVVYKF